MALQDSGGVCDGNVLASVSLPTQYLGGLLSLGRFLFIASHRERFDDRCVADMCGVFDGNGAPFFGEAVGRKFFDVPFKTAAFLQEEDKNFIAASMPIHLIYAQQPQLCLA
jgi:arginine N-succinyltransferase